MNKIYSRYSSSLCEKINEAINNDLCAQRDRLIDLVSEADLETKVYRKAVDLLSDVNDMFDHLQSYP